MDVIITVLIVVIVLLIILIGFSFRRKISLVMKNSVKLEKLDKLNKNTDFIKNCKKTIKITSFVTKKEKLSSLDINALMNELFIDNTNNSLVNFESIFENDKNYVVYEKKYNAIKDKTGIDFIKLTNLSEKSFTFLENKLFKYNKLKPTVKTKIMLTVKYDGQTGDHEYKKDKTFSYSELINMHESMSSKKGKK